MRHSSIHSVVNTLSNAVIVRVIWPANKKCVIVFIQSELAYGIMNMIMTLMDGGGDRCYYDERFCILHITIYVMNNRVFFYFVFVFFLL